MGYTFRLLILFIITLAFAEPLFAVIVENPVLIISSYNPETRTTSRTIQSFMQEYEKSGLHYPVAIENMNCKSFSESYLWKSRFEEILDKYEDSPASKAPIALVILGQEAWASYLSSTTVDRRIPVIAGMISQNYIPLPNDSLAVAQWKPRSRNLQEGALLDMRFGGIVSRYDLPRNLSMIRKIYPSTENIVFLSDNTYGGVNLLSYVNREMEKYPDLNLIELDGRVNNLYTIQNALTTLPPNSVLVLGSWRIDRNDSYFLSSATYTLMCANSTLPAFSLTGLGMGHWAIGGYFPAYKEQGSLLAHKLISVISERESPGRTHLTAFENVYTFDFGKLGLFKVPSKLVPEDCVMLNRDKNFLEANPRFALWVGIVLLLLVVILLVASLFILKLRRLNASLRKSELDNSLILHNIGVGLVYVNSAGIVEWESTECFRQYSDLWRFQVGEKCHLEGDATLGCTKERIVRDGDTFFSVTYNAVEDPRQERAGYLLRIEDVTRRELSKTELERAKERAEEADHLKSNFLANMSHEIRTPLNAIVGFSEIIINTEDAEEKRGYMEIVRSNNELLLQLINDIIDLSKIEAGTLEFHKEAVDLNHLMGELFASFEKRFAEKGIDFRLELPSTPCTLRSDALRLTQLLSNFLTNAAKFTSKGWVALGYRIAGEELQLYVSDTGCGISKESQRHIFHRFVKLNSFVQGTGLGLSICEMIAEHLGGTIHVESQEGEGSTFRVSLPLSLIEASQGENGAMEAADRPMILVAEDEADNYRLLEMILQREYRLIRAHNGAEAVEKYKRHAPDLVLMDIQMPVMDGYEATREIRKLSADTPVVAVTAYAFTEEEKRAKICGFTDYIRKPINKTTIKERIKTLLN